MGAETEVITHTVTIQDASVSLFGFGIPLIAGYHTYWADLVRTFNDADEMTVSPLNMPKTHAIYLAAKKLKSQTPSPPSFKVGKLTGIPVETIEFTPTTPGIGEVFTVTIDGVAVTFTADATPTLAEVTAGLTTAINALTGVSATDGTTKVTVISTVAGLSHAYTGLSANLKQQNTTAIASPTVSAELANIKAADGDWYGLAVITTGKLNIADVAAWVESQRVIYLAQSADNDVVAAGSSDIASVLNTAGYTRSSVWWHPNNGEHLDASVLGALLPKLPGPVTFANKGLAGVTRGLYDATKRGFLKTKKANYYQDIKGLGFTLYGWAASGRFLDVTVAVDWFDVGIENRIVTLLRNNDVVPYTDKGIETVRSQVLGQIQDGIALGIIDGAQPYAVTVPKVATINPVDKSNRFLPDVRYNYVLSGAIHSVKVIGIVQV